MPWKADWPFWVVINIDPQTSAGELVTKDLGDLAQFALADVRDEVKVNVALDLAENVAPILGSGSLRRTRGQRARREGRLAGRDDLYAEIVTINLFGTFNMLRPMLARMASNEPVEDERGVCILTDRPTKGRSAGQIPYAFEGRSCRMPSWQRGTSPAGSSASPRSPRHLRHPILDRLPDRVRTALEEGVPHPSASAGPRSTHTWP